MTKIMVVTPAYGEIFYGPYVHSLIRLLRLFETRKWQYSFSYVSYADIVESRNYLLTQWFDKSNASHLLFVDADMGFPPELVTAMIDFDKPIVGAVYPKRQINLDRVTKLAAEGEPACRAIAKSLDFIVRNPRKNSPAQKGFIEVEGCGTGIMLIKRSCVEQLLKKMPQLSDAGAKKLSPLAKDLDRLIRAFEPLVVDGARLSEDYSFCHRWRQCGGEVWGSIAHEITHVGLHRFKGRYSDAKGGQRVSPGKVTAIKTVTGQVSLPFNKLAVGGTNPAPKPSNRK